MFDRIRVLGWYLYYKYRRPFRSRDALLRWQRRHLRRHLRYVMSHVPFYAGRAERTEEKTYPVTDKAFMRAHFRDLNTAGIDRKEAEDFAVQAERTRNFTPRLRGITVGLSSGTSGRRGIFLISDAEKSKWAGYILAKFLPGRITGRYTIAFFMRADSNLYQAVGSDRIRFCFFDIYQDMETHQRRLEAIQPDILAGQPSLLLMLAAEVERGRLRIRPRTVISIAEVLEAADEKRLQDAFGLPVIHQVYQCTEGCLASTCRAGTLHLHEDIVRIEREYLDERRFVPIVTDLERRVQPIIRYRLNDILVERVKPCPCGSPCLALEKIEGREDDIFRFPGRDGKEKTVFPDFIRRCILFAAAGDTDSDDGTENVKTEYRVIQEPDGAITVCGRFSEAEMQRVREEFAKLAADGKFVLPAIRFAAYVQRPGRKMKRVERRRRDE